MKFIKYFSKALLGLMATASIFAGCSMQEEVGEANAVLTDATYLEFEAQSAPDQTLNVSSDGNWVVDVPVEWLTVTPMSGRGNVQVTLTVADNYTDGVMDAPRETVVIFRGASVERQGEVVVVQKGDTYLGVSESTVTQVAALEDKAVAKIAGSQVVAVAADGFLITDGTTIMYVKSSAQVAPGDKLFLNGAKSTLNKYPSFIADEVTVLEAGQVVYPTATDLTSQVDAYAPEAIEYVKIEGTLVGTFIKNIAGSPSKSVSIVPASATLGIEAVAVHKLTMYAYHVGFSGGAHQLVVVSFTDNGVDDTIGVDLPFKDNFDWTDPYIQAANAVLPAKNQISDAVGQQLSSADGAANIYSTLADNGCMVLDELRARGYVDLNPSLKTIYLQDGYFKFSKGDCQSGLTLPVMKMDGAQDIAVQFKWCAHIGGSGSVDKTELIVAIEGPGTVVGSTDNPKQSVPVKSTQATGQMFWQDVVVYINGATSGTFITIRPKDEQFGPADDPASGYFRYHLDNISVMRAADLVPAHVEVKGVEDDIITFEGSPEAPAKFSVLSDKEFTIESDVNWLSFNVNEGPADITTEILVTCQESTLSELRRGVIKVVSGTTVHKINVIQSAAGVALSPFISLVDGNSISVDGMAGVFEVKVQGNVDYVATSQVDWLTVEPQTKALVDFTAVRISKKANLTGESRKGQVVFVNTEDNVETVLTVDQDIFTPEVTAAPVYKTTFVSGYGCTINYSINANVPYAVTTDSDWVKLPASQGPAGNITIPIQFLANNTDAVRTATVTFHNPEYDYTAVHTINQYPSGIVFQEDFSWMAPMIAAYNATVKTPIGDTVGTNGSKGEAPNAYTKTEWLATDFWTVFNAMGYENTNPSAKVLYPQDAYLKFGKTGDHSGLFLPSIAPEGDVTLTFNWCAQVQGSGVVDPVKMLVELQGDGVCADTNDKISTPTASTQPSGTYEWQTYTVTLKGVTPATRILIRHNDMTSGKAIRFHLDNIKIVK